METVNDSREITNDVGAVVWESAHEYFLPLGSKYKVLQRQKERTRLSGVVLIIIHLSTQSDIKEVVELNRANLFKPVTTIRHEEESIRYILDDWRAVWGDNEILQINQNKDGKRMCWS